MHGLLLHKHCLDLYTFNKFIYDLKKIYLHTKAILQIIILNCLL